MNSDHPGFYIPPDFIRHELTFSFSGDRDMRNYWELQPWPQFQRLQELAGFGKGLKIGVADTFSNLKHSAFKNLNIGGIKNFTNDLSGRIHGHGDFVLDQIARMLPEAEFFYAGVLNSQGSGSSDWILNGCKWLADQGCILINRSLGSSSPYQPNLAWQREVKDELLCVDAGGNTGRHPLGYPARHGIKNGSCAVGSYDVGFVRSVFTSIGEELLICGAGGKIRGADGRTSSGETVLSGTSMAAPDVCWKLGALINIERGRGNADSPSEVYESKIKRLATDMDRPGHDPKTGYGYLGIAELLEFAEKDADRLI